MSENPLLWRVYQMFELDKRAVDVSGRAAGMQSAARNSDEFSNLGKRLSNLGYHILTSDNTYSSLPEIVMVGLELPELRQTRVDIASTFIDLNTDRLPYTSSQILSERTSF